jgi:hypothetical protein
MGQDGIIPFSVEGVRREIDSSQLGIGHLDPVGYLASSSRARTLKLASVVVAAISWTIVR